MQLEQLIGRTLQAFRPPPMLQAAEWAKEFFRLPPESPFPGKYKPWPMMIEPINVIGDTITERVTLMKGARLGYALDLNTPIPTRRGWTTMGEVQPGDELFDEKGNVCKVNFCSPVFQDHDCYEITFCDGSKIVADGNHRWFVNTDKSLQYHRNGGYSRTREGKQKSGVVSTQELFVWHNREKRNRFSIPVTSPLELPEADLPIPPYTLGLWLGDGHSATPRITQHASDVETAVYIRAEGIKVEVLADDKRYPNNRTLRLERRGKLGYSALSPILRSLGLLRTEKGCSALKRAPDIYLRGSQDQRLALLRGLMDSDGTIERTCSRAEFNSTSKVLCQQVRELLSSFGIKSSIRMRVPKKKHHLRQWRVNFRANSELNPFLLRRKRALVKPVQKPGITYRRRIVGVRKVATRPVRCIQVDSPSSLFLAGECMIPTHNTKALAATIGMVAKTRPCPIIVLLPRDADAVRFATEEIASCFAASPQLTGILKDSREDGRTTQTIKTFPGGSLKMLAARSPDNLRAHDAKYIYFDEVDAFEMTDEGDPVQLGITRTVAHYDRKIVMGSTPTIEGRSIIEEHYLKSDRRIFEVPCLHCGTYFELLWHNIVWATGDPKSAVCECPSCSKTIDERHKREMAEAGVWHKQAPDVIGHAGFKLNALVSPLPNAAWSTLAAEYIEAKHAGPTKLMTFVNTVEGRPWRETSGPVATAQGLLDRQEDYIPNPLSDPLPERVLLVSAGIDFQPDRWEGIHLGVGEGEETWELDYQIHHGAPSDPNYWQTLQDFIERTYNHPLGGVFPVEAAALDSGDNSTVVYEFVNRMRQAGKDYVHAVKGVAGEGRPLWQRSLSKKSIASRMGTKLELIGVDDAKTLIYERVAKSEVSPGFMHFRNKRLEFYEQLLGETVITKVTKGRPKREWVPLKNKRHEVLDCYVYALAARHSLSVDWDARRERASIEHFDAVALDPAAIARNLRGY